MHDHILLRAGDPWHKGVKSVSHNCFCGENILISDGVEEEEILLVQGSAWGEGELLMMSALLTWWKCL